MLYGFRQSNDICEFNNSQNLINRHPNISSNLNDYNLNNSQHNQNTTSDNYLRNNFKINKMSDSTIVDLSMVTPPDYEDQNNSSSVPHYTANLNQQKPYPVQGYTAANSSFLNGTQSSFNSNNIQMTTNNSLYSEQSQNLKPCHDYKSAVVVWNLNKYLRKLFLPVPLGYCSKLWCVKDCGGYIGAGATWLMILAGMMLIFMNLWVQPLDASFYLHIFLSITFASLAFVSHWKSMFSDPGAVPRGDATPEHIDKLLAEGRTLYRCVKCNSLKPDRTHHCSTCRRCIRKMDHHCPWINNCVGENNQKYFVLFTMYIFLVSFEGLGIAVYNLVSCAIDGFENCSTSPVFSLVVSVSLIMEGALFGLFTLIMCCTQVGSICWDQTGIESLKKEKRQRRACYQNLKEVFGERFSYKWFSPFHPSPYLSKLEQQLYFTY